MLARIFLLCAVIYQINAVQQIDQCPIITLGEKLEKLNCSEFENAHFCAKEARRIANDREPGTWGSLVLRSFALLESGDVDLKIHDVSPLPSQCNVIAKGEWHVSVFRTGTETVEFYKNQVYRIAEKLAMVGDKASTCEDDFKDAIHKFQNSTGISAVQLSENTENAFRGYWNAMVVKSGVNISHIGYDIPHYFNKLNRDGFCLKKMADGTFINVFKIEDRDSENDY
jgi:hypothetical protein